MVLIDFMIAIKGVGPAVYSLLLITL